MKFTLIIVFTLLFISTSVGQSKTHLLNTEDKFTADGKIETVNDWGEPTKIETGKINGVGYRFYYTDASGSVSAMPKGEMEAGKLKWSLGCKKDAIDDKKICYMSLKQIMIFYQGNDKYAVSIGSGHYPRSSIAIRIDNNPAIKGGIEGIFPGDEAKNIIEQLKTAKQVATRYQKFPNSYTTDETFEIYGFSEAFQYLNWAYSKIR